MEAILKVDIKELAREYRDYDLYLLEDISPISRA